MKEKTIIFHNPSCSKSCESLDLLQNSGAEIEIINYLEETPSAEELKKLIALLGIKPHDLVRKGEEIYLNNFQDKNLSNEEWIEAMIRFPILIERPIVVQGNKALIGRPPKLVLNLL